LAVPFGIVERDAHPSEGRMSGNRRADESEPVGVHGFQRQPAVERI